MYQAWRFHYLKANNGSAWKKPINKILLLKHLASDEPIQRTFKDVINKANLKDAAQRIKEEKVGKGRENDQKLNKIEKTIHANLQLNPPGVAAPKTGYTARILYDMKNCQKVVDKKA